jgi:hypothetical protein
VAVTDHAERAPLDRAEELQEARVAGTVDAGRPHDGSGQSVREALAGELLALQLGLLVDVSGIERSGLVSRNDHVAVNPHGAAMDDALHSVPLGRIEHVARAFDIDEPVHGVGKLCLAIERGDVTDHVAAGHRAIDRAGIGQISLDDFDGSLLQITNPACVAHEGAHVVATTPQRQAQVSTCEA